VGDTAKGFLIIAAHEGLKAFPIDACSGVGAMMARDASRRYAELDARARENSKQIRPEESDPASIDIGCLSYFEALSRLQRQVWLQSW
jgi:hypothetical protein